MRICVGAAPQASESVLLLGATGAAGKNVLRDLLASTHFSRVVEADILSRDVRYDDERMNSSELQRRKLEVLKLSKRSIVNVVNAAEAAEMDDPKQWIAYLSSAGAKADSRFLTPGPRARNAITLATVQRSTNLAPEALATNEDPKKEGVSSYWVIRNKRSLALSKLWK
ncbi:hypothetical protein FRC04_004116 [Tulasnella sp. 424]|nr:hypothetical protein FRC04_004116 [Tulasnella sp. 424]